MVNRKHLDLGPTSELGKGLQNLLATKEDPRQEARYKGTGESFLQSLKGPTQLMINVKTPTQDEIDSFSRFTRMDIIKFSLHKMLTTFVGEEKAKQFLGQAICEKVAQEGETPENMGPYTPRLVEHIYQRAAELAKEHFISQQSEKAATRPR